jgi:DNA-directed RNA polymerase specialized sigma24 family protein
MTIPPGHTEQSVLDAIERSVAILAPSFVFGPYDIDDVRQQARLYALEAIEGGKYDPSRPLENFIYTHCRNRLINLKRDKLHRTDVPCRRCHEGDFCTSDGVCKVYSEWRARNSAKANLMRPVALDRVADEKERRTRTDSTAEGDVQAAELKRLIDEKLPVELRADYLKMLGGVSIPPPRRKVVEAAVKDILRGELEWPENEDD